MRRRQAYPFVALGVLLVTGVVVARQQSRGTPVCSVDPDGSCAFVFCSGSFPDGCTPAGLAKDLFVPVERPVRVHQNERPGVRRQLPVEYGRNFGLYM
jgi:hypothetical protein